MSSLASSALLRRRSSSMPSSSAETSAVTAFMLRDGSTRKRYVTGPSPFCGGPGPRASPAPFEPGALPLGEVKSDIVLYLPCGPSRVQMDGGPLHIEVSGRLLERIRCETPPRERRST